MCVGELFGHQDVALPRQRDEDDYESFLAMVFEGYLRQIDTLSGDSALCQEIRDSRSRIQRLAQYIIETIRAHSRGPSEEAYQHLRAGFQLVHNDLENLLSLQVNASDTGPMYRMRGDAPRCARKADLFHKPFELRDEVKGWRYSDASVRCLYLGGSLRVCWLELGKPRTIAACRLACADGTAIRVLNFGYRPSVVAYFDSLRSGEHEGVGEDKYRQFISAYAVCWPLIAASSIKPKDKSAPSVPEYIIPQMIVKWLRLEYGEHHWDGIRYFSTEMVPRLLPGDVDDFVQPTVNFAFPTRTNASHGHCPTLRSKFPMSEPISAFIRQPVKQLFDLEERLQSSPVSAIW